MTRANVASFTFPQANFIGFNHIWSEIEKLAVHANDNYPPHNVVKLGDDQFAIELAVAGFGKEELDVELKEGVLVVRGDHKVRGREYLHKGVSTRKFIKTFRLSEHVVVNGADFKNGLLVIDLKVVLPEEKRPRKIQIGNPNIGGESELLTEESQTG